MTRRILESLIAVAGVACGLTAAAEDIDLFVSSPLAAGDVPNVLIVVDNTATSQTEWPAFTNEMRAIVSAVNNIPVDGTPRVRLGLMLFAKTDEQHGVEGGYVRAAARDLTADYKARFLALANSLDMNVDGSNGDGDTGLAMAEAYYYFNGDAPLPEKNEIATDYDGNTSGTAASQAIYALPGNALPSLAGSPYNSPVPPESCARNFVIYISNGALPDDDAGTATTLLAAASAAAGVPNATTAIPISPSGSQSNMADEWARFMIKSGRNVATYTLDVDKATDDQGRGWTALLKSMASSGGGRYFDVGSGNSGTQVAAALDVILSEIQAVNSEIQAVNSVSTSVSLALSTSAPDTFVNRVYVGMYRPDANAWPRWNGNLKQYKLGFVGTQLDTLDADDASAIDASTGAIADCARSIWSSADNYWTFKPQGGCLVGTPSVNNASNAPDGNIVEKGAQAQRLRETPLLRVLKTCTTADADCGDGLVDFNSTNVTQAALGASDSAERDALIAWQRGRDVDDEDIDGVTTDERRPSSHGDVLHSRPVAVNYGTDESPEVVVFYGGNDGVLRAVNGNRTTPIGTVPFGRELWAFVPPEFIPQIKRLRDNSPQVSFFGQDPNTTPTPQPKPYGLDGTLTTYTDEDDTWLFAPARRGGRVVYAFDVTTIDSSPTSPTLLWKKGCPNAADDTDCSPGFEEIGQTWSALKQLKTEFSSSMLIMGGGYDPCEDEDPITDTCRGTASGRRVGNRVYVLDAETGNMEREVPFETERGVTADVFVVPDASTGLAKYAYIVDLGGNLYRISGINGTPFGSTDPASWQMTKIAELGCTPTSPCPTNDRKFLFSPDVVEKNGTFYITLGSGDREKPVMGYSHAYAVQNYFFMIKDDPSTNNGLPDEDVNCGNVICLDSLAAIPRTGVPSVDPATGKGWYLQLHPHEQVVTAPITVFGTVTFSTHTPAVPVENSCGSSLGTARVYNIAYLNAASRNRTANRWEVIAGGGLPPSPVAGQVRLDNGRTVPFIIGASADSPLAARLPTAPSSVQQPKSTTFWVIEK